ncbi:MAG: hypothetical protein QF685_12625 [Verrucomicrobiota bacterium]|nr:hypothetical protein [Verrucomicrobiota bacterium]
MKLVYSMLMRAICLAVWLGSMAGVWADTITTRENENLQGEIVLDADGTLRIGRTKVALKDLKLAKFEVPQRPEPETGEEKDELKKLTAGLWALNQGGALSWGGSFIARKVVAMDDTKVSFEGSPKELFLSTVNTSAVFFKPVTLGQAFKLKGRQPGVLLASGNFVEGKLKSMVDGTVVMESILFGRKSYMTGTEAVALWLREPKPTASRFTLRTRDGSVLLAKEPLLRDGALILSGSPFRNYRIARDQLVEIRSEDAADVLTLAWAKVNNAAPEKRAMLQASVANVGRALELRAQLQTHEFKLQEAKKLLANVEAAKVEGSAKRQRFLQDWKRLQDVWRQKNREYWKTRSNKSRMTSKARQEQMAVARAERALENYRRTLDKHTAKLGILEKAAKEEPEKDMRRNRESFVRSIKRANRDIQKAQKKLNDARRDNDKILAETKLLPAEEKSAKQILDQSKKDTDQAMVAYRQTIADYQAASRQAGIARGKVAELQQAKDQATQELEKLRSKTPALPSNK